MNDGAVHEYSVKRNNLLCLAEELLLQYQLLQLMHGDSYIDSEELKRQNCVGNRMPNKLAALDDS